MLAPMSSAFPEEYQEFTKKLRIAREEAGLSQMEVARRIRRNQTFVSKIELGERRVDPVELRHLAEIYGKPISFFI